MLFVRARSIVSSLIIAALMIPMPAAFPMEVGASDHNGGRGSAYSFKSAEACFMRKVNQTRQRYGLRALQWDKQLGYVARRHARQMATNRAVYHDGNVGNEVTHWRSLAQNTGRGDNCKRTFRSFMASPPHRENILGSYRFLGVGIEYRGHYVYVQQLYEKHDNPGNVYNWP